jgi:sterol 3beta-glucosyltransferase
VEELGLEFTRLHGDSTGLLYEPAAQKALQEGSFLALMRLTAEWDKKFDKAEVLASYQSALAGADVVVSGGLCMTQSWCVAEANRQAWVAMILGPTLPTSEFPIWPLKALACGCRCLNKWTYSLAFKGLWGQEKPFINPWREATLGMPPITNPQGIVGLIEARRPPILIACSNLLCGPQRRVPGDYPPNAVVRGFVFVPPADEGSIPAALPAFLRDASKPVIYLGFGSMPAADPAALVRMAVGVCVNAKCKAVVVAGWSQLENDECQTLLAAHREDLLVVKAVPHDWLFPRVACAVHHCGVGTMAAALRAGVPQVPCPFMLDQPHNAQILVSLGVAPAVVPYNSRLSAATLAAAVAKVLRDGDYRDAAEHWGRVVREESAHSLERYSELIESAPRL